MIASNTAFDLPQACSEERRDAALPIVSVVMPVRNEARHIERTLAQLLAQDFAAGAYEILIIDGGSTDGTPERVQSLAVGRGNVRLFDNPRRWSSAGRNIGVQNARGDIVVIVDGHCEITDRNWLRNLVDAFGRSGADCIGRPQPLDVAAATPLQQTIAAARLSRLGHHPDSYVYSTNEGFVPAKSVAVAYRRAVFNTVGLFDEQFDACEDVELNHRIDCAGLRCYFTPRAAVRYCPRGTLGGLFRQLVRYGRGRIRLLRKHRETLSLRAMIPLFFVAGLVVGLPLTFVSPWFAEIYRGALALYAAIVTVASAVIALRARRVGLFWRLPLVFATIHVSSGVGMLLETLRLGGRRPETS